ncbi:MAG: cyclic nucleotide-binding domain-containing protein [Deltaproteobacteria bacterium]|nr:cyclic nucleotide-binding domain-containing protein [Deltaproteobacteria bacterium]
MGLKVAPAVSDDEKAKVYEFRYRVYVEELEIESPEADHSRRWLRDPADDYSTSFALLDDGEVMGLLRATLLSEVPDIEPYVEKYGLEPALGAFELSEICATSRFMLDSRLRGSTAVLRLVRGPYLTWQRRGVRLNYGDCSPHLVPFYEHMGFRRFGRTFNDAAYGFKIPILMLVSDVAHFERVRSPFARLAKGVDQDHEARDWFERSYPDAVAPASAALLPEGEFLDLLATRLADDPVHALGLLRGLDRGEADRFLERATLIRAEAGDRILRQNEAGDTTFVLVSGVAEVMQDGRSIRLLGAGDPFGEIALLTGGRRSADVTARTDCEAVVLSSGMLTGIAERDPVVGAKILLNLTRILALRLTDLPSPQSVPN